jgi:hypothetical protein
MADYNPPELLNNEQYNALIAARMRILPEHIGWVVNLIGAERAVLCTSIPEHIRAGMRRKTTRT